MKAHVNTVMLHLVFFRNRLINSLRMFSFWRFFILIMLFSVCSLIICNYITIQTTQSFIYNQSQIIPYNKVALLPGTSHSLGRGIANPFFENRMDAAWQLYASGKISYIVVSGDNRTLSYNEPAQMRAALVKRGVPDSVIISDYAGLRTLDSVLRCRDIFGQTNFTIISQQFQNERALFIAQHHNINAIAYNAKDVTAEQGLKTSLREYFARVKMFVDLYITNQQPHHSGCQIAIGS